MPHTMVDRRTFLARTGVLGLALAAPPGLLARADANPAGDAIEELVRWLRPQLRNLAIETYEGLAAFVAPGDDRFSALQHQRLPGPGGVAAGAGRFTLDTIDGYLPVPDRIWIPTMLRSTRVLGDLPTRLPDEFRRVGLGDAQRLDRALEIVIENDETLPAAIVAALLLNVTATILTPQVLWRRGAISPFTKLSYNQKARVFRDLEATNPKIVTLVRQSGVLPGWLVDELNNLIKYLAMAMLALPANGTYNERQVFDREAGVARERPIGWDLTGYAPGRTVPTEGYPELRGWYQDRTEVEA